MNEELLRIRDLDTDSPYDTVLKGFRLQAFEGEISGLVGLNGSGKRTLVKVLSGDIPASAGTVKLAGVDMDRGGSKPGRRQLERSGLFVIRHKTRLIKNLTIGENLSLSSGSHFLDMFRRPHRHEKIIQPLLNELAPDLDCDMPVVDLPPAEHTRVGLLKAFMEGAKLIVLDEVLEFCSRKEEDNLLELIERLQRKGIGFIITYNRVAPFLERFDRITVIREGRPAGMMYRDNYESSLLAHMITGSEYEEPPSRGSGGSESGKNKLLEIQELKAGKYLLRADFYLCGGEILGIYDPLRDMTDDLLRVLSGMRVPEGGSVIIGGKRVVFTREYQSLQSGVGVVWEKLFESSFFKSLNAGENLLISTARRSSGFLGNIPLMVENFFKNRFPEEIGISSGLSKQPVEYLERDKQFILALNMKILSGAKIFLLENPVRSADLITRDQVFRKMESLRERGMGVIFISGDYTELDGFCDRILYCDNGKGVIR